jgi:hypothetical protein
MRVIAAAEYPLLNLFWTMLLFFGFVIWVWLLFLVFGDVLRRQDTSGWAKAGWVALLIVLPVLGVLVYVIAQGGGMAERRTAAADRARSDFESDVRAIASENRPRPGDEIASAKRLLDSGAITADEYELLKRRALGLPPPVEVDRAEPAR